MSGSEFIFPTVFSLHGDVFGGDGYTTFALPDLKGRLPMGEGQRPGLTTRVRGQRFSTEKVTLTSHEMPQHTHWRYGTNADADNASPENRMLAKTAGFPIYAQPTQPQHLAPMDNQALKTAGGDQSHSNMMPFLCINFIIALAGTYPQRS